MRTRSHWCSQAFRPHCMSEGESNEKKKKKKGEINKRNRRDTAVISMSHQQSLTPHPAGGLDLRTCVMLRHTYGRPHTAHLTVATILLQFVCLPHPACSPDLTLTDSCVVWVERSSGRVKKCNRWCIGGCCNLDKCWNVFIKQNGDDVEK